MAVDILDLRRSLHNYLDPRWKSGFISREDMYKEMSDLLNKEAHISEMNEEEISKAASYFVEKDKGFPCKKCRYYGGIRHYLPICKLKIERTYNACRVFKENIQPVST